ncbi:MAG: ABC-F type ribosomal protection protein [Oscillospiraceae bacterium]|nr:ABC-F type ribosomal protection protein [Oscillospiraceae bacterium]
MSSIQVKDLSFTYPGSFDPVFEHCDFQLDTNWKLGFTGRNGRGKTTFLRLLMGEYDYQGSISKSVDCDYFPFRVTRPERPAREILDELHPELEEWRLLREMAALSLDEALLGRSFATLSPGEQTKLLLALLFTRENRFLLIDEPTNHLDLEGRELVGSYLNGKRGFILVSHDRALLDACVDHILSINKTTIEVQRGNFSSWWENKELRDRFELAENEKLKREIRRLKETVREKAEWSDRAESRKKGAEAARADNKKGWAPLQGAKAKKSMARAKAIESRQQAAIEEKSGLLKDLEETAELKLPQLVYHSERLLLARDLAVDYGAGPVFEGLRFDVRRGDRIALRGRNGSGKSSLLKLVCGEEIPHTGVFERGSRLVISYVPQDSSFLRGGISAYARGCGVDESLLRAILHKLGFVRAQFDRDLSEFSAGQKKKVLIARSLCEPAHLHVWDEPLNYIDVISRMQIEELLLKSAPTLLFVEHDKVFCDKIATRTIEL